MAVFKIGESELFKAKSKSSGNPDKATVENLHRLEAIYFEFENQLITEKSGCKDKSFKKNRN